MEDSRPSRRTMWFPLAIAAGIFFYGHASYKPEQSREISSTISHRQPTPIPRPVSEFCEPGHCEPTRVTDFGYSAKGTVEERLQTLENLRISPFYNTHPQQTMFNNLLDIAQRDGDNRVRDLARSMVESYIECRDFSLVNSNGEFTGTNGF